MSASARFYVREHVGLAASGRQRTEVMVVDRDYCHRVMRSWTSDLGRGARGVWLPKHRGNAAAYCAELNAWQDDLLAAA